YFNENDPCKPLHPIDFFIGNACAALYLDGSNNPEVYYYYRGEKMRSLGVNFEGYLELLLKSRGFWYWQVAIAGPEYVNPATPMPIEERNFRKIMPQLFSNFNSSDFKRLNGAINQETEEISTLEENEDNASIALLTLEDFLETKGWNYQALEDGRSYKILFERETGQQIAYAEIPMDLEQFLFYVKMPVKVPEELRNTISEFITRANYGLGVGNFEMDYDDGEVSYKSCVDFKGENLTIGYIKNAILPALKTMELYTPGFMSVIDGEKTPEEAIADLEEDDD
ncbi:MAG TPA: YbjN domain-containing protein, partial [Leptolyngbyaceae cyanobacterium]